MKKKEITVLIRVYKSRRDKLKKERKESKKDFADLVEEQYERL